MRHIAFPIRALLTISLTTLGLLEAVAQDHCWIKYSYDGAGNRIERKWWCGDPNEVEHDDDPSMAAQSFGFSVAPNPTSDRFTLLSEQAVENAALELLNAEGRSAIKITMNGTRCDVDVSKLEAGTYVLTLRTALDEFQSRITVVH